LEKRRYPNPEKSESESDDYDYGRKTSYDMANIEMDFSRFGTFGRRLVFLAKKQVNFFFKNI